MQRIGLHRNEITVSHFVAVLNYSRNNGNPVTTFSLIIMKRNH